MPINPDLRPLYPPNWRELAAHIKFERAGGRCERCGRPHGVRVLVIGEGGWLDPETGERNAITLYAQLETRRPANPVLADHHRTP